MSDKENLHEAFVKQKRAKNTNAAIYSIALMKDIEKIGTGLFGIFLKCRS